MERIPFAPFIYKQAANAVAEGWSDPDIRQFFGLTAARWQALRAEPGFLEELERRVTGLERDIQEYEDKIRSAAFEAVLDDINDPHSKSRAATSRWALDRLVYQKESAREAAVQVKVELSPQSYKILNDQLTKYAEVSRGAEGLRVEESQYLLPEGEAR